MNLWKPYLGRLVFTALGLVAAIMFLLLGFAKTVLIILCCGIGYIIGTHMDKGIQFPDRLRFWRNKW